MRALRRLGTGLRLARRPSATPSVPRDILARILVQAPEFHRAHTVVSIQADLNLVAALPTPTDTQQPPVQVGRRKRVHHQENAVGMPLDLRVRVEPLLHGSDQLRRRVGSHPPPSRPIPAPGSIPTILVSKRGRNAGPQPLSGDLDESKIAHRKHRGYRSILTELGLKLRKDLGATLLVAHVNEVDHDDAAQIAQTHLPRQHARRFQIHL